ncbi:MAG: hypothetical protein ACOC4E_00965 [Patescibacteria group bacterium]
MRRAVGFLIVLWGLSLFFSDSFLAADKAGEASFQALEAAATLSQHELQKDAW